MEKLGSEVCRLLKEDARLSVKDIASLLGKTEAEIKSVIEKLEADKTIVKYVALVNNDSAVEEVVEAMIEVKVSPMHERGFDEIAEYVCQFEEVKNLFLMSGGYDLAIYIEGKSLKEVALFVSEKLSALPQILSTATHFVLKRYTIEGVTLGGSSKDRLIVQA